MGGWRVDQTKKIRKRKRGRQEFSMQDYDVQNAGRVMPEDTPVRRGQGAVLNTDGAPEERSTPRNQIHSIPRTQVQTWTRNSTCRITSYNMQGG